MAGAVGAVLQLVGSIGAVLLPVTQPVLGYAAGVAGVPGRAGELAGTAGVFTCGEGQ